jgi:GNAT superfamily N-acetyltransferase
MSSSDIDPNSEVPFGPLNPQGPQVSQGPTDPQGAATIGPLDDSETVVAITKALRNGDKVDVPEVLQSRVSILMSRLQREESDKQLEMLSFQRALRTDHELAGEAQRLGIDTGLDPRTVEANIEKARELKKRMDLEALQLAGNSEILAQMFTDPEFAGVAGDQVNELGFIEKTFAFASQGYLRSRQGVIWDRIRQGTATMADRAEAIELEKRLWELPEDSSGQGIFGGLWYGTWSTLGQMTEAVPEALGWGAAMAGVALAAGQSGPQVALPEEIVSVPTMFWAGFRGGMFGHTAAVEAGHSYKTMRSMGVSHEIASQSSWWVGAVNGAFETAGFGVLTKVARREIGQAVTLAVAKDLLLKPTVTAAAKRFALDTLKATSGEVLTEVMQEVTGIIGEQVAVAKQMGVDPVAVNWQNVEANSDYVDRIAGIIAETIRGSLLIGSFGPMLRIRRDVARIREAKGTGEFLQNLQKGIDGTTVTKRAPNQLQKFLRALSEGSPVENIYFKPEEFAQALEQAKITPDQLTKIAPDVAKAFAEGQATGVMEIPVDSWGARFMSSQLGKALAQDARVDPDGVSIREVREVAAQDQKKLVEEAKKILSDKEQTDKAFVEEVKLVRDDMKAQLLAANPKITPDEAAAQSQLYGHFVTVYSQHEKMSPVEWHETHGLRFISAEKAPAIGRALSQDGLAPKTLQEVLDEWTKAGIKNAASEKDGVITLDRIVVPNDQRGQGVGTAAMQQLINYADATGQRIALSPSVDFGASSKERLTRFYKGLGFVANKGRSKDFTIKETMIREPQPVPPRQARPAEQADTGVDTSKRGASQHQMTVQRSERKTKKVASLSSNEKAAIKSKLAENIDKALKDAKLSARDVDNTAATADVVEEKARVYKRAHPQSDGWTPLVVTGASVEVKTETVDGVDRNYLVAEPVFQNVPYGFNLDREGGALEKGEDAYQKRAAALAVRLVEEVRGLFRRAVAGDETARKIIRQAAWYRQMRSRLRREFGGLGDLFADLLGATSPNTPVRENWAYAVDVLRRATRGDWDAMMPRWEAWVRAVEDAETEFKAWFQDERAKQNAELEATQPDRDARIAAIDAQVDAARADYEQKRLAEEAENPTGVAKDGSPKRKTLAEIRKEKPWKDLNQNAEKERIRKEKSVYTRSALMKREDYKARAKAVAELRKLPPDLTPVKEPNEKGNTPKYGFNGRNIVRALVDLWRVIKEADPDIGRGDTKPKALNFSGNLIGFRAMATIDVWAARLLQRLFGLRRIPSKAESSVSGSMLPTGETTLAFGFGQDVFALASKAIRDDAEMNVDDVLKQVNDDDLQAIVWFLEKEIWTVNNWTSAAGEGGSFEFEADLTGQLDVERVKELRRIADSSKSTAKERQAAIDELSTLTRSVDRFVGMISQQRSGSMQGEDVVPTNADQSRLQERLHTAILESEPENSVVANKVANTVGLYGDPETSIDMEVVTKAGFDVNRIWLQLLREGLDADQDSVGLSRVLRESEEIDYSRHRPGVEIYFRQGGSMAQVQPILDALEKAGVSGYTVIVDGRRSPSSVSGEMPTVVGVRFQFAPEMEERLGGGWSGLPDEEIASRVQARGDELIQQANKLSNVEGVSFAGVFWYETKWAFRNEYEGLINGLAGQGTRTSDRTAGEAGWVGDPVAEGVARAAVRREEAAVGGPVEGTADAAGQTVRASDAEADGGLSSPTGRGSFYERMRLAVLEKDADPSTVIHEMSHFFFTTMVRVASKEGAPRQLVEDVETILRWFAESGKLDIDAGGFDVIAQWNALSFEEQERFHEQLAYSFELYVFEGKAPAPKLEGLYARMRTWMIRVYRDIRDTLNRLYKEKFGDDLPVMSPEVKLVFDRMLASQDTIEQAEAMRRMLPLYQDRESFLAAGFSEDQWDEYQKVLEEAHAAAVTDMTRASLSQLRWLKNARSRVLKQLQKENAKARATVEEAIRAELKQERVYMALDLLREASGDSKLSLDQVREKLAGLDEKARAAAEKKLGTGKRGALAKKGADIEVMAQLFGYESADMMLREMVAARPIDAEVEARTDAEMLKTHGEITDPERMEVAIEKALHNEARARFVAVEQGFLSKSGKPARVMVASARFAAQRLLEERTVRSLRPDRYAQAEARAARDAERASRSKPATRDNERRTGGDLSEAVRAKARQLLNNQLVAESIKAREEVGRAREFAKRFNRSNEKLAKAGFDVNIVNIGRWILARTGMLAESMVDRTVDYMEMLERYDPVLFEEYKPWLARFAQGAFDYRDLSLGEFRAMTDAVKTLWARAKMANEVKVGNSRMAVQEAVRKLHEQIDGRIPDNVAGTAKALTKSDKAARLLLGTKGNLTRVEHLFRAFDGGEHGVFSTLLFDEISQALDRYRAQATVYTKKLVELVRQLPLNMTSIDATREFGYTFKNDAELVGLLLHMGNKSNREKVLIGGRGDGKSWGDFDANGEVDISRWLELRDRLIQEGRLKKEHFAFAQAVWDMMEQIKPTLQEAHLYLEGYYFKEVQAESFTIEWPDGTTETYAGGYVPAAADADLMGTAQDPATLASLHDDFRQEIPKVQFGNVKERIDNYRKRPLSIDIRMIAQHIDKAMRFAHVQPRLRDAVKILSGSFEDQDGNRVELSAALNRIHPNLVKGVLMPWLDRAATQTLYKPGGDGLWNAIGKFVRRNTGVAIMMLNPVNALQQLTGITNSLVYVKSGYLVGGLKRYMSERDKLVEFITERSEFMEERLASQTHSLRTDLHEMLLNPSSWSQMQAWTTDKAYALQAIVQNQVDIVTWTGAFDQAMATMKPGENVEQQEARAVAEANSAVRLAQGSFNPEDVANYEVGSPWQRAWTQFTGFFNNVLNTIGYSDNKVRAAVLSFSLPMVASEAIAKVLWGQWESDDPDQDEWLLDGWVWDGLDVFVLSQLRGSAAFLPAVGPAAVGVLDQAFSDRQFGDRVAASPPLVALTRSVTGLLTASRAVVDSERDLTGRTARDALTAITVLTGAPLAPLARPVAYGLDWARGKIEPTSPFDAARGLITGRASTGSKQ